MQIFRRIFSYFFGLPCLTAMIDQLFESDGSV